MKYFIFSFLFLFLRFPAGAHLIHPVHVSVSNIVVTETAVKVQVNTFIDDWETAYYHYHGKQTSLKSEDIFNNQWFNTYFNASFKLAGGDGNLPIKLSVDTIFFDELAMTIKMHGKLNNQSNSLYIYNAILTDIFADQNNLVIISFDNKEKGIKFDVKHKDEVLKLK